MEAAPPKMTMSKPAKPKPLSVRKAADPQRRAARRRVTTHVTLAVLFLASLGTGFYYLQRHVSSHVVFPADPPRVVLLNRPSWMTDGLAQRIIQLVQPRRAYSATDPRMLRDVTQLLEHEPWIKQVRQVRRAFDKAPGDTLEIDCEYRIPIALVEWRQSSDAKPGYYLVDNQAVLLGEQYLAEQLPQVVHGSDGRVNLRILTGVECPKPKEAGQKWAGDDLIAGLELAKCLYGLPYAQEIEQINVANFLGRIDRSEAQLVLLTRYGTQVQWGRPISAEGFEVPVSRKLEHLRLIYEQYRRVDAGQPWIDLRFDQVRRPKASEPPPAHASGR